MVQMNMFTQIAQKLSHRCRRQSSGYGAGGRINYEIETHIYTLRFVKQIISQNLLYGTEKSTQYSVMTHMGTESKKECIDMYV